MPVLFVSSCMHPSGVLPSCSTCPIRRPPLALSPGRAMSYLAALCCLHCPWKLTGLRSEHVPHCLLHVCICPEFDIWLLQTWPSTSASVWSSS